MGAILLATLNGPTAPLSCPTPESSVIEKRGVLLESTTDVVPEKAMLAPGTDTGMIGNDRRDRGSSVGAVVLGTVVMDAVLVPGGGR